VNTKLGSLASLISFIVSRSHRGMTPSLKDHALLDSAARFSGCGLCVALLLGRRLAVPAMQAKLCLNQISNYPVAHQSTSIVIQFTSFHLIVLYCICSVLDCAVHYLLATEVGTLGGCRAILSQKTRHEEVASLMAYHSGNAVLCQNLLCI